MTLPPASAVYPMARWSGGRATAASRVLPEETPIALVHDATTTAVMMATPRDLEDFGVGFSLTEGLVGSAGEIVDLEIARSDLGIEVRMWLARTSAAALAQRRRRLAGPTGCGVCGLDSLEAAVRPPPTVTDEFRIRAQDVQAAMAAIEPVQALGAATHAVHAAAWWTTSGGLWAIREDVGRHNALDKLAGARARAPSQPGVLVLTSRVSVEMVQKAAAMGAEVVAAISAPTLLAVRTADRCGVTLAAVVRDDGFEVFSHPHRITA